MDYSKMKATKVEKNAKQPIKVSKKDINSTKKSVKKLGVSWIVVVVAIVIGLLGGYFITYAITKNDTYEMITYANGSADVYIGPEEDYQTYVELGVKCVAFGKDVSKNYTVTYYYRADLTEETIKVDDVDINQAGVYYAVYKAPSAKYTTVKLIRNIFVLKEEDDG